MDCGNRNTVVASSLLALTWLASACLVLSDPPCFAQVPDAGSVTADRQMSDIAVTPHAASAADHNPGAAAVVHADAEQDLRSSDAGVQQVAGILGGRTRSGGLLQALVGGNSNTTTHTHTHTTQRSSANSGGLLGGLFRGQSSDSGTPKKEYRVVTPLPNENREPANWDGIPFHRATSSANSTAAAPIRDPGTTQRLSSHGARISSIPSPRSIPTPSPDTDSYSSSGSSRRPAMSSSHDTDLLPPIVTRSAAPVTRSISSQSAPPTVAAIEDRSGLSDTTSSRRSGRRNVDALDASEIAAAAKPTASTRSLDAPTIQAPKVARRELPSGTKTTVASKPTSSNTVASQNVASQNVPSQNVPSVKAKPKAVAPNTVASTTTNGAAVSGGTASGGTASGEQATSTLAAPRVSAPATQSLAATKPAATSGRYTTPVSPEDLLADSDEEEPLGSVPLTPYAASAPDMRDVPSEFQARNSVVSNRTNSEPGSDIYHSASSMPNTSFAPRVAAPTNSALTAETADSRIAQAPATTDSTRALAPLHSSTSAPLSAPTNLVPGTSASANTSALSGPATGAATSNLSATSTPPSLQTEAASTPKATPKPTTATTTTTAPSYRPSATATTAAPTSVANADATKSTDSATTADGTKTSDVAKSSDAMRSMQPNQSTVASELPGIRVATFGPNQITIRQSHPYEIRIENRGAIDASGVIVRANIPSWAEVQGSSASRGNVEATTQSGQVERLVWKIDSLPAGATERMFVRLKAVRSGSHDMDVDWTLAPQKSIATVYVQEPKLAVAIDGPDQVTYGESKTYKVRISNPGDGVAPNVMFTLSPNSSTPQTQRIGDIPAGKEASIDIELTAQDLGDLSINGLALADLELRAEAAKTIRVVSAKLQAILSGPQVKYQNTESTYRLEIKNAGSAASEQVVASLRLPVGVKYLGGIESATQRADLLTWKIDSLQPGAVRDYQFKCNMNATGDQLFSFECRGTAAGQATVAIATRVEAIADLVLTVNDPPAPAPVDTEVTYEIVIRNRGSKEATEVAAVAQFSLGIEPQRVEGQTGQILTGQVVFDPIPRIAPGEERVLKVIAKAETDGHHRFRTEIRSGDTVLVAEEATHYMDPQSDRVSRRSDEPSVR